MVDYSKVGWRNEPERTTPINASNLEHMDEGIKKVAEEVNSVGSSVGSAVTAIGTLSSLTTDAKTNLVSAINEVDSHTDNNTSSIGTLTNLTTSAKNNLVSAINEVDSHTDTNTTDITNLQGRMTTAEGDIDTLEGAVFSERKVYTERFATNVTGNGRLMLMVSAWKKDTACISVRFQNRVTGGFTDVVLAIKQNSYYTKCKKMYNDGIPISKIYRGSNNTTFDFEIPTNNAYDVYVTAPVWVSGTYGAQTTLSGTEMTVDGFDYNEMELTVGNLNSLSTTTHYNIVAAINEVNGRIVDTDYVVTEYSVPYVSGTNTIFMLQSNDVAVVGDEEYLLNMEIIDANGNAVEMLFITTDDSVENSYAYINHKPQTSSYEAIPISKVEDASSFGTGNKASLWVTLVGTPDVTVRLMHHKSKTYRVEPAPSMPSGTGRELPIYVGNFAIWSKSSYNGQTGENVVRTNSGVSLFTDGIDGDIGILNTGEGDSQFANVRVYTPEGDVRINNNHIGKTSLSGIGDGTITGAIAFGNDDGEEVIGEVVTVTDAIDANAVDISVDIEPVQEGSGTPSPTNVRPIRAVTETGGEPQIKIQRIGKNLFGGLDFAQKLYDSSNTHDLNTADKTVQYNRRGGDGPMVLFDRFEENTAYTLILTGKVNSANTTNNSITFRDSSNSYMSTITFDSTTKTRKKVTVGGNGASVKDLVLAWSNAGLATLYYEECGLFEGDVSIEEFEEYLGETYIINTGSNVYGCTLDATTGKMVITHKFKELDGSLTWQQTQSGYYISSGYSGITDVKADTSALLMSNLAESSSTVWDNGKIGFNAQGTLWVGDANYQIYGSLDDFKAFINTNPLQVVYELATPQTIQLTPQQIKMLKGTNTVSSNAQTLNLTYLKNNAIGKAVSIVEKEIEPQIEEIHNELDTKLNTDSIAPVENGATASTSYAVGDYITRNNNLYKVISAISQGATFTTSNIQKTTVMAEILSRL